MEPIPRVSARVLPVSPDGEVLLLHDQDPTYPGVLRWGTIGGALDPGETHEQAAVRELYEETGTRRRARGPHRRPSTGAHESSAGTA